MQINRERAKTANHFRLLEIQYLSEKMWSGIKDLDRWEAQFKSTILSGMPSSWNLKTLLLKQSANLRNHQILFRQQIMWAFQTTCLFLSTRTNIKSIIVLNILKLYSIHRSKIKKMRNKIHIWSALGLIQVFSRIPRFINQSFYHKRLPLYRSQEWSKLNLI